MIAELSALSVEIGDDVTNKGRLGQSRAADRRFDKYHVFMYHMTNFSIWRDGRP